MAGPRIGVIGMDDSGGGDGTRSTGSSPGARPGGSKQAARRARWRTALRQGPPGPSRPDFWRSPVRGPWLTSVLGLALLAGIAVVFTTGLLSYAAYNPDLAPVNDMTPGKGLLGFYLFDWPTSPHWLYRLTQGLHVTLGVMLVPVLLAKLWSVIPKLFVWPPVRSPAHALERLSLLLLVGGGVFQFATGLLNVQLTYLFPGSFYSLHFYGAWVFIAALAVHVALRMRVVADALRRRRGRGDVPPPAAPASPNVPGGGGLEATRPAPDTLSRRGVLGLVGLGSLTLFAVTAGQSIGGPLRATALLAPRGRDPGPGPNGFQVNKTTAAVGITPSDIGPAWRLRVRGNGRERVLSRAELLALAQHSAALPIACVEGWSTTDQDWSGVRLADLAALVGAAAADGGPPGARVESVQAEGAFRSAALRANQVRDPRSLLALRVNGADLSPDHGFPARVIVPANPGVHNTKWVGSLDFGGLM